MGKSKDEKIAEKISREQNTLVKQWVASQKTIEILMEDFKVCQVDISKIAFRNIKFWKKWFNKSSIPFISGIELNKIQKQYLANVKTHNEFVMENEKVGQSIVDFGSHIDTTFRLMDVENIKPEEMNKILTIFEDKIMKIKENYAALLIKYEDMRRQIDSVIFHLKDYKC